MILFIKRRYIHEHVYSNFYACLDGHKPFINIEERMLTSNPREKLDVTFFIHIYLPLCLFRESSIVCHQLTSKPREMLLFSDLNACTRTLQHGTQQLSCRISQRYNNDIDSNEGKESLHAEYVYKTKLMAHVCFSVGCVIGFVYLKQTIINKKVVMISIS